MVKNPPANAGDTGSIPVGSGKIPRATELGSPCTTAIKAYEPWSLCFATGGNSAVGSLCAATREQPPSTMTREKPATSEDSAKPKVCINKIIQNKRF